MNSKNLTALSVFVGTTVFFVLVAGMLEKPLPKPLPSDAAPAQFSAERAMAHVAYLCETLGLRPATSDTAGAAAAYIASALSRMEGVEVARQVHSGTLTQWGTPNTYSDVVNILARIPGEVEDALLISAHYDSPHESPGAADDAASIAAMLEVIANLQGQKPHYTLIFNFNGAEEQGLMGAHAFVAHPWYATVKAFVNLEAAGNKGKQLLFRAAPGAGHLVAAFAEVPYVRGNVIGQELVELLGITDTDFRRYVNDGTVPGIDLALADGGYVYHTMKDTPDRLDPAVLQAQGDNLLALTKALAYAPWKPVSGKRVYFDLLGWGLADFDMGTVTILGLCCSLALLILIVVIARRHQVLFGVFAGLGTIAAATLSALVLAAIVSGGFAVFKPMSWFATPWTGYLLYGGITLLAVSLIHGLWHARQVRKAKTEMFLRMFLAQALVIALLTALTALAGSGTVYLALIWSLFSLAALLVYHVNPHVSAGRLAALQILVPGLFTTAFWHMLLAMIVPSFGYFGNYLPIDTLFAVLVALAGLTLWSAFAAYGHRAETWKACSGLALIVILIGALSSAGSHPYTDEAPKRLTFIHDTDASGGRLLVRGEDTYPIDGLIMGLEQGTPTDGGMAYPTRGSGLPLPLVEVRSDTIQSHGLREIALHITAPGAYLMDGHLEGAVQWVQTESRYTLDGKDFHYRHVGNGTAGYSLVFAFDAAQTPPALRFETYFGTTSQTVRDIEKSLPTWTTVSLYEKTVQNYTPSAEPAPIPPQPENQP